MRRLTLAAGTWADMDGPSSPDSFGARFGYSAAWQRRDHYGRRNGPLPLKRQYCRAAMALAEEATLLGLGYVRNTGVRFSRQPGAGRET